MLSAFDQELLARVSREFRQYKMPVKPNDIIAKGTFGTIVAATWNDQKVIVKVEMGRDGQDFDAIDTAEYHERSTFDDEIDMYRSMARMWDSSTLYPEIKEFKEYAGVPQCMWFTLGRLPEKEKRTIPETKKGKPSVKHFTSQFVDRESTEHSESRYGFKMFILPRLGENLFDYTMRQKDKKLPPILVAKIGYQVLQHLEFLCNKGIVHRDIKPDNLLISDSSSPFMGTCVYLVDFGLSKQVLKNGQHIAFKHQDGLTGTLRFAGIHAHERSEASFRCDLQALSNTLLFLVRGSLPWQNPQMAPKRTMGPPKKKREVPFIKGHSEIVPKNPYRDSDTLSLSVYHRHSQQERHEMQEKENFVKSMKKQVPISNLIKIPGIDSKHDLICLDALGELAKYANSMEYGAKPDFHHLLAMFFNAIVHSQNSSSSKDSSSTSVNSISWII